MKFERLKKWKDEFHICIRCGYCYEHCPLFKLFGWETDTPRGKILLSYGLMTGEIKPSEYVAEKLFQCFYCKNCSDNCPSQVPVTDIITDARADIVEAGFTAEGTTATIDNDICSTCGLCLSVCKAEAISFASGNEEGKKEAAIDKIKCKGCGLCISTCPSLAISQKEGFGVSLSELNSKVDVFLTTNNGVKLVVFCCNWSIYPGLQLSTSPTLIKTPFGIVVTMCSGRVTPELILKAFKEGAWGVMISGCPPGECEHDGNYKIMRRVLLLRKLLKQLNINPNRIKIDWFSNKESEKMKQAVENFIEELRKMGPLKIK
jgi:coenzyme F420-reducing hydrogenase delta subunit/ferredoxin